MGLWHFVPLEQNVIVLWDSEGTDCCLGRNVFTMITRSLWKHASFQKSHENNFLPLSQTGYLQSKNEWPRMFTIGRIVLPIMVIIGRIAKNGYYRKNSYSCRNRNDYTGTKCHSAVGLWHFVPLEQNVIVLWDSEGTDCCLGRNNFTMITSYYIDPQARRAGHLKHFRSLWVIIWLL